MENGSCYQTGLRRFPHILLFRWVWRWELLSFVATVAVSPSLRADACAAVAPEGPSDNLANRLAPPA